MAVLAKSAGSYHWTPEGRKLADFSSGVLVMNLGHNPTRWWQRVNDYLGLRQPATGGRILRGRHAQRLQRRDRSRDAGDRAAVSLHADSSPAALAASKCCGRPAAARRFKRRSGRRSIAAPGERHHPQHPPRLSRQKGPGRRGHRQRSTTPSAIARVRFISFPREECISVARRQQPIDLAPYEAELSRLWSEYGSRICCLITEPYLGGGGSFHPQKEYIQLLERFCREHDIIFILDEVQANFGRTGSLFAFTEYGVEPDIVVLGKGLGNGVAGQCRRRPGRPVRQHALRRRLRHLERQPAGQRRRARHARRI